MGRKMVKIGRENGRENGENGRENGRENGKRKWEKWEGKMGKMGGKNGKGKFFQGWNSQRSSRNSIPTKDSFPKIPQIPPVPAALPLPEEQDGSQRSQIPFPAPNPGGILTELGQGDEGGVDGQGELDGQLRRHHGRQDQGTLQEQAVLVPPGILGALGTKGNGSGSGEKHGIRGKKWD